MEHAQWILWSRIKSIKTEIVEELDQIKSSATEHVSRDVEYVGICDSNWKKLGGAKMLNTYYPEGNEILMALPKRTDEKNAQS